MGRKSRLYRLYDGDNYIGAYTCKEISEITGCQTQRVCVDARNLSEYKKRWRFIAINEDGNLGRYAYDFAKEWNDARIGVYKKEGKTVYICDYCGGIIDEKHMRIFGTKKHMHYKCFKKKCEGE